MHCLILGKVWPEPTSTAAGRRTLDLIESLQSSGWTVSFASAAQASEFALDLSELGVTTYAVKVNDASFDAWVAELSPDVVIFDRFMTEEQFGWRVERACPDALRVLDTSDLHCLREARQLQLKVGGELELKNELALREIASIWRSDLTLMISEAEMSLLAEVFHLEDSLLAYFPFFQELSMGRAMIRYEDRRHFIMIGSFMHAPNLDAARWCRAEIWPLIRQSIPSAELHCYGSYGDKYAGELDAPDEGFHYKGRAENAVTTMQQYRVNFAPLRFGAGLKGKLFDAFLSHTPSVTTPVGAEGIPGRFLDWGCSLSESAHNLARNAVIVHEDPATWERVRLAGETIVQQRFLKKDWLPRLNTILGEAKARLVETRQANFTGRMLRHHQHRSTEFMSRWIEAKNRD